MIPLQRVCRSTALLQARAVLENVHVRGMPAGLSGRERAHLLNTMLTLSSDQQVCAAGALLAILSREGLLAGCSAGTAGARRKPWCYSGRVRQAVALTA